MMTVRGNGMVLVSDLYKTVLTDLQDSGSVNKFKFKLLD